MKHLLILLTSLLLLVQGANAELRMGSLFCKGMVLQQQQRVRLWGWTTPGKRVTVKSSWGEKESTKAQPNGRWEILLPTPKASYQQHQLKVSSPKETTLLIDSVMIGEVWFASGQSNMEMPLKGFDGCPTEGAMEHISTAMRYRNKIRMVTVPASPQKVPADTLTVKWEDCSPQTAANFCAVAYFFGIKLQEALDCPIGLINSSLGATRIEGWTPRDVLQGYSDIDLSDSVLDEVHETPNPYNVKRELPLVFYNGMIHPFEGYAIKGFLWYQGEANVVYHCQEYATRLTNMVNSWRSRWQMGNLPFYYVEICPFDYWWVKPAMLACQLREQQLAALNMIDNAGMVSTNDLVYDYEHWQIHPCMKQPVGERLCLWALAKAYGIKGIECENPTYESWHTEGNSAVISFRNAQRGFNRNTHIEGFEICGPDSIFHPAQVGVNGNKITCRSPKVTTPIAVRYCYKPFQVGNLKSLYGLPVVSFRTDSFPFR